MSQTPCIDPYQWYYLYTSKNASKAARDYPVKSARAATPPF
jgi:hypothetical protein